MGLHINKVIEADYTEENPYPEIKVEFNSCADILCIDQGDKGVYLTVRQARELRKALQGFDWY